MLIGREIMCGLTYLDIVSCAGMSQRQAADRLGVSYNRFNQRMKALGMGHYFDDVRPRPRCISREDIISVAAEGYTQKDAAEILGVSWSYLLMLVKKWGLRDHFPTLGEAHMIGKRGYCI